MKLLNIGLCAFFLAFAALRAARVPLTYDEAASYIRYIDTSVPSMFDTSALSIFSFEVATNHFLNTLSTKASYLVAGGSEIALRLPNLIGYAMFLGFSLLILQRYVRPLIATAGFLLLNLNPYMLDFFTLSRGYGLSLGFLMGSLFYLFKFLDEVREGERVSEASRALAFALGAVMSNFALLNVWLSVFGVILAAFVLRNMGLSELRIPDPESRIPPVSRTSWRPLVLLSVATALFSALVFSQDAGLSKALYEPVTVTITGLDQAQRDRVTVVRVDLRGRDSRLRHDAGHALWRVPDPVPYRGLRIEVPVEAADRIEHIEVAIGSHLFSFDPRRAGAWNRHDENSARVFEPDASIALPRSRLRDFQPVINWAGDTRFAENLAAATACALGILAVLALALKAAGSLAVRLDILTMDQWRPLASSALWVAALAGPPLYLLRRNAELYFGGTRGLVADTFYSTIENSFYGRIYHPDQIRIVFIGILATLAVFAVVLSRNLRRHTRPMLVPAIAVLTILVLTSVFLVFQRVLFDTVYLAGRTALFYIPLYVLLFTLLCDAMTAFGGTARAIAMALLIVALSFASYHFATTANLKYAWDWPSDASTRMMMEDLEQVLEAEGPRPSKVILGVESAYLPVAVYYSRRQPKTGVDIISLPASAASDFQYIEDTDRPAMNVVRRYPHTRTALVRTSHAP
jgi:hypothetical protein